MIPLPSNRNKKFKLYVVQCIQRLNNCQLLPFTINFLKMDKMTILPLCSVVIPSIPCTFILFSSFSTFFFYFLFLLIN